MAKITLLIFIGLIHFIELIPTSPIHRNFDVTLENEIKDLIEVDDTGDEEPAVYVFKRMVDEIATKMNGKTVSSVRYQHAGVDVQETTMIVDGKPFVMGSYSVMDPYGYDLMTIYVAGKGGIKTISKFSFQSLSKKERNKQNLLKSALGGR